MDDSTTQKTMDDSTTQKTVAQSSENQGLFPINPVWFKISFYSFLSIWLAYMLYEATTYTDRMDYVLVYSVMAILIVLLIINFVLILYPDIAERVMPSTESDKDDSDELGLKEKAKSKSMKSVRPKDERDLYEVLMVGWVAAIPIMMYYLGQGWTSILYIFGFIWFFKRDVKFALSITVLVNLIIAILFVHLLNFYIWTGALDLPEPYHVFIDLLT